MQKQGTFYIVMLLASLFLLNICYALPFNIFTKNGTTLPTTVSVGATAKAYYTVQNNTGSTRNDNFVKYLPPNVSQVTSGGTYTNTCGTTFSLGPKGSANDNCTLQLAVTGAVDANDPDPHHHLFVCFPGGTTCAGTTTPLNVTVANPPPGPPIGIAAGWSQGGSQVFPPDATSFPLLSQTTDGGINWSIVSSITGLPNSEHGAFFSAGTSCSGFGSTAHCVTGGVKDTYFTGPPLLVQTLDGGANWSIVSPVIGLPGSDSGAYFGTDCRDNICLAAGEDFTTSLPLLVQSLDGGSTWSVVTVLGAAPNGFFQVPACTDSGTFCVVTGENTGGSAPPILAQTTNGGITWSYVTSIPGLPSSGDFSHASCGGSGSTAICVAIGFNFDTGAPLMAQSTNGGVSWSIVTIPSLPDSGSFSSVACSDDSDGPSTFCIAAGQVFGSKGNPSPPLLVQTTNGGGSWSVISSSPSFPLPNDGSLNDTSCTGKGSSGLCVAAGVDSDSSLPLLVESTNGGSTWKVVNIAGVSTGWSFNGIDCNDDSTAFCVAVGADSVANSALLVQSLDNGNTWNPVTLPALPTPSVFNSVGSSD
jgi:hypothetical protein